MYLNQLDKNLEDSLDGKCFHIKIEKMDNLCKSLQSQYKLHKAERISRLVISEDKKIILLVQIPRDVSEVPSGHSS